MSYMLTIAIEGVLKQSDNEAYLWGRRAANKGHAKAEYAVGCKYMFRENAPWLIDRLH
jgi:TPR repeat protein